jgi:hypothetical protein
VFHTSSNHNNHRKHQLHLFQFRKKSIVPFYYLLTPDQTNTNVGTNEIKSYDITAWTIGDSEALSSFIDLANSQSVKTVAIDVQSSNSTYGLDSVMLNDRSIIVFDGAPG